MPSPLIEDIDLVEPLEIQQAFVFLSDEVSDLQVVDNFLLAVERRYLQESGTPFDPKRIRSNLAILESFSGDISTEKFARIVAEVQSGIEKWNAALASRDEFLHAYHLRQYCDEQGPTIKPIVYSALTRFYKNRKPDQDAQSKFDLSITRLFSKSPDPPYREILIEREDLVDQIAALFESWDAEAPSKKRSSHSSLVSAKLDDFQREALSLKDYQELFQSDLFDRLREFKRKLGSLYSQPEIAAAAIDCNIAVGNVFHKLLASANKTINEKVNEGVDLAGAFVDASRGAEEYLSEILGDLRSKGAEASEGDEKERASLDDILSLVCESPATGGRRDKEVRENASKTGEADKPSSPAPSLPTAQKRLEPFFFSLSQPEPDFSVIRSHVIRFPEVSDLNLKDFRGKREDPNDHLCRNVLGVILWIEELCENELSRRGEMTASLKDELHRLLRRSEEFSEQLDYLVRENASDSQNRLLIVSNGLLESRIRLKRGIARFTRRNLEKAVEATQEAAEIIEEPVSRAPFAVAVGGPTNRWLVAATLLVTLISAGIYFFDSQMNQMAPIAADVELLDTKRLPNGEHLSQGFQKDGLMMVTARDSWLQLPEDEQRKNLKDLKEFPTKVPVKTVMVTDTNGRMLGDMSGEEARILGRVQIADAAESKGDDARDSAEESVDSAVEPDS